MDRRRFIGVVGGGGMAFLAGCTDDDSRSEEKAVNPTRTRREKRDESTPTATESPEPTPTATEEYALKILEDEGVIDRYTTKVEGVAKNVSEEILDYAEVTAIFYNEEEQRMGEGLDNTTDLYPDEEWAFTCTYFGEDEPAGYRLATDYSVY